MKLVDSIIILAALLTVGIIGCGPTPQTTKAKKETVSYTTETINQFNNMEAPVTLVAKNKSFGMYSVTLRDGRGKVHIFHNLSTFANQLGDSYNIKDTIK